MKYISICLLVVSIWSCQNEPKKEEVKGIQNPYTAEGVDSVMADDMGSLVFEDSIHDFGNLKEGDIVIWDVSFRNTGKSDIIINNAHASCGCTVPEFPIEPIKPGSEAKMSVKFDSKGKSGLNEKSVTVTTNGFPSTYILKIKANVN